MIQIFNKRDLPACSTCRTLARLSGWSDWDRLSVCETTQAFFFSELLSDLSQPFQKLQAQQSELES
ncbi:hypothetical protein, partial [Faecalibaculum rodentium]|uniref:hypothetical protein n=1 Tax=Faecalibaculum rodentium TaxID=1702221 RepID=UPI0023F0EB2B